MMLDWNTYQQQLLVGIGQIGKISPDTVRGYRQLSDAGNKTGKLDTKTRELIALAVAVTRQCDGCITVHTDAAGYLFDRLPLQSASILQQKNIASRDFWSGGGWHVMGKRGALLSAVRLERIAMASWLNRHP